MSSVAKNNKYLKLDEVRISYRSKDDSIHITSADEDIAGESFHLTLGKHTESEQIIRELLIEKGLIRPQTKPTLPTSATLELSSSSPADKIVIGVSENGAAIWEPKIHPHAFILGSAGQGKSIILRSLFAHCLTHNSQWQFYGIDLTTIELNPYRKYTNTITSIAENIDDAKVLIEKLHQEMLTRYSLMEKQGVNRYTELATPMRSIVFATENASMLMVALTEPNNVEVETLAQLNDMLRCGRAAGIHVVFCAQTIDSNLFPNRMRVNFDFCVAAGRLDSTRSAILLGTGSAVRIPSGIRGRALLSANGEEKAFQAAFSRIEDLDEWVLAEGKEAEPELYVKLSKKQGN